MNTKVLSFDTEFTGLRKDTTLISLGVVDYNSVDATKANMFYAEFTDYDKSQCDEWIKKNVISKLILKDMPKNTKSVGYLNTKKFTKTFVKGDREFVKDEFIKWINQYYKAYDNIQMVSDVCHYDFVLFIDLFGSAFDLPDKIVPYCKDITEDLGRALYGSYRKAFDYDRTKLFDTIIQVDRKDDIIKEMGLTQHNSLCDAFQIAYIYDVKEFLAAYVGEDDETSLKNINLI